ncbi:MAG TPA: cation diffusion facilitator family transporter [Candidatus Aquicultor sp.]|jgi:cation diffusion facilitator family transporter
MGAERNRGFIARFNTFLLRHFVPNYQNVKNPEVRARYGYVEGVLGTVSEIFLFTSKLIIGVASGSIALIAEAFHSLSDILSSLIVIVGFRIAGQPADPEHPYGHGRFEAIATLIIAVILVALSIELVATSIERLINPIPVRVSIYAIAILVFTIVLKEFLARVAIDLGRRIDARMLVADSANQRVDSLSAIVVLIGLAGVYFGFNRFDAIAGLAVVGFILYTAYTIALDASSFLLGQAPSEDTVELIRLITHSVKGIKGVHAIYVHDYGSRKVVTLHILVDGNLTVEQSHAIADEVERRISETIPGATADVHIGPARELKIGHF